MLINCDHLAKEFSDEAEMQKWLDENKYVGPFEFVNMNGNKGILYLSFRRCNCGHDCGNFSLVSVSRLTNEGYFTPPFCSLSGEMWSAAFAEFQKLTNN